MKQSRNRTVASLYERQSVAIHGNVERKTRLISTLLHPHPHKVVYWLYTVIVYCTVDFQPDENIWRNDSYSHPGLPGYKKLQYYLEWESWQWRIWFMHFLISEGKDEVEVNKWPWFPHVVMYIYTMYFIVVSYSFLFYFSQRHFWPFLSSNNFLDWRLGCFKKQ